MRYRLPLCLALALLGCDSSDDDPTDSGAHSTRVVGESQVGGAFDDELEGRALFAEVFFPDQDLTRFRIQLQTSEEDRYHRVSLDFHDAEPPREQTYPCDASREGERDEVSVEYLRANSAPAFVERYFGSEGEVVITDVSRDEISGTIDCSLLSPGGTRAVEVTGTFRARQGG